MSNRPKPTQLKLLQGNPGKRPMNKNEPKPCNILPSRPEFLKGPALHEWVRISRHLGGLKMATPVDRAALAAYCVTYGRWVDAEREIERLGIVYKTKNGLVLQSPFLGIANRAMELMHKFLIEFGMTPSSRARLSMPKADVDEMSAWEDKAKGHRVG